MKALIWLPSVVMLFCCGLPAAFGQEVSQEERLKRILERYPAADLDKDGTLTREEAGKYNEQRRDGQKEQRPAGRQGPPPTHADVSYGDHEKQAFDIWLAKSKDGAPTPLVIYIHGGGFRGGDKGGAKGQPVQKYLDLGISLWLAFHEDLAKPDSKDPVARQSTRIVAAGTQGGQSTYDMRTFREWFGVPDLKLHPALETFYDLKSPEDLDSKRVKKLMEDASPITHLTKDDPPVFMVYSRGDVPVDKNSDPGLWVHHARLGLKLEEAMGKLDLECHVTWRDHPSEKYESIHEFLRAKVK